MVSVLLAFQMAAKKRLGPLSRDVLRPAAAGLDEMYIRRHSSNIFEVPRMKLCYDSNVKKKYTTRTPVIFWKPSV